MARRNAAAAIMPTAILAELGSMSTNICRSVAAEIRRNEAKKNHIQMDCLNRLQRSVRLEGTSASAAE
jgi:hypothetical protein